MSRGSKATIKTVRPGIMPPLFGRHLIDKCVFLGLNEVAHNLPPFSEECIPVRMDKELATAYRQEVEEPLSGGHQGNDEASGSAAAGRVLADAARLSRLSVRLGADRLLEGRSIRDGGRTAQSRMTTLFVPKNTN